VTLVIASSFERMERSLTASTVSPPSDVFHGICGPVAVIRCQGIGNVDSSVFSEGLAVQNETTGIYTRLNDGAVIGDCREMIETSLREGVWTEAIDELEAEIERQWSQERR